MPRVWHRGGVRRGLHVNESHAEGFRYDEINALLSMNKDSGWSSAATDGDAAIRETTASAERGLLALRVERLSEIDAIDPQPG